MTDSNARFTTAGQRALHRRALVLAVGTAAVLGAILVADLGTPPLQAQSGPAVLIELERDTVAVGEEFDVFAYVEGADDLAGFDLALGFDEASLSYVGAEIGTAFLESGGRTVIPLGPVQHPNRIEIGAVTLPGSGQAGANGGGDLAVFAFRALAAGETTLSLTGIRLVDTTGTQNEPEAQTATLAITGQGPRPTPASTATASPLRPGAFMPFLSRGLR